MLATAVPLSDFFLAATSINWMRPTGRAVSMQYSSDGSTNGLAAPSEPAVHRLFVFRCRTPWQRSHCCSSCAGVGFANATLWRFPRTNFIGRTRVRVEPTTQAYLFLDATVFSTRTLLL